MSSACLSPMRIARLGNGGPHSSCPMVGLGEDRRLIWVAMITSAENRSWPDDVPFGESYRESGLPAPSVIRPCKLATIEGGHAEKIGQANAELMEKVIRFLRRSLAG